MRSGGNSFIDMPDGIQLEGKERIKEGDYVICFNASGEMLTNGRRYKVHAVQMDSIARFFFVVTNDNGDPAYYSVSRFEKTEMPKITEDMLKEIEI